MHFTVGPERQCKQLFDTPSDVLGQVGRLGESNFFSTIHFTFYLT